MPQMVVDSSTLILLAKCSLLQIVCDLFDVIVPRAVNVEVASADLVQNYPDAALISDLTSKGAIKVQSPDSTDRLTLPLSLHKGEEDALLLAVKLGRLLFATDDGKAIKAARFFKVPFIITPKIVVELFRLQKISFKKARESLEKLAKIGRYSPEIIADALVSLMEEKNGKTNNHKDTGRPIK
jgi:predicted nucleic acid-binding protein